MTSDSDELQELRSRVAKLERRNAKWRLWLLIVLLILFAVNTASNLQQIGFGTTSIATRNLVLKDAQGKNRAYLTCSDRGPGLVFLDSIGNVQVGLTTNNNGTSYLSLHGKRGTGQIALGINDDSSAYVMVSGKIRKTSSRFFVGTGDSTYCNLRSADDSLLFHIP